MIRNIRRLFFLIVLSIFTSVTVLAVSLKAQSNDDPAFASGSFDYRDTFIITAYYSPLQGQERYVTGTYEGDIRLNGHGVHGADGTDVYFGMIAAPSYIPFGTKMEISGLGIGTVHDRGGAIKSKDATGLAYDRLDVWMGYGDSGLKAALTWGKRTVEVTVYGIDENISDSFYVGDFSLETSVVKQAFSFLEPKIFPEDLWYGQEDSKILLLQQYLKDLDYFEGSLSGFYGDQTFDAVYRFQKDQGIVDDKNDLGAGHFGINTRRTLERIIEKKEDFLTNRYISYGILEPQDLPIPYDENVFLSYYPDLKEELVSFDNPVSFGDQGELVRDLQEELVRVGFLRIQPTGFFGEITRHALFKFQQAKGLVDDMNTSGAGSLGPKSRALLNSLLNKRTRSKRMIALKRSDLQKKSLKNGLAEIGDIFDTDLGIGDRGVQVEALQKVLKSFGFFQGLPSQYFGKATKDAVIAFQLKNNILQDPNDKSAGRFGPKTRKALNSLI